MASTAYEKYIWHRWDGSPECPVPNYTFGYAVHSNDSAKAPAYEIDLHHTDWSKVIAFYITEYPKPKTVTRYNKNREPVELPVPPYNTKPDNFAWLTNDHSLETSRWRDFICDQLEVDDE